MLGFAMFFRSIQNLIDVIRKWMTMGDDNVCPLDRSGFLNYSLFAGQAESIGREKVLQFIHVSPFLSLSLSLTS